MSPTRATIEAGLATYNTVPERIEQFRAEYPTGRLAPLRSDAPFEVVTIGGQAYIAVVAGCWLSPDDPAPGVGMAWEVVPGLTPYTKNSELQNAETSAWGRAIVARLVADARKGIASQHEVDNRNAERAPASNEDRQAIVEWTHRISALADGETKRLIKQAWKDAVGQVYRPASFEQAQASRLLAALAPFEPEMAAVEGTSNEEPWPMSDTLLTEDA